MLALVAMLERADTGDLDTADATARQALTVAEEAGDAFATAHALTDLWLSHGIRRDHAGVLGYVDQALRVLGDDPGYADLRSFALDDRIFTLQNLDRWPEAELALQGARESARRSGSPDRTTWVTAAVLRYWLGQWDDALAELSPGEGDAPGLTYTFLRERWPALLVHGVAALRVPPPGTPKGNVRRVPQADPYQREGLAGDPRDHVEVVVVVEQRQAVQFCWSRPRPGLPVPAAPAAGPGWSGRLEPPRRGRRRGRGRAPSRTRDRRSWMPCSRLAAETAL